MTTEPIPRGIRNNNPLNIRISTSKWKGKVLINTDGQFEQFHSMEWGIRAAIVLVRTYIRSHHIDTVAGIINRWAPSSENNTQAYINNVAEHAGLRPSQRINANDRFVICKLLQAMAFVENGRWLHIDAFTKAWTLI